MPPLTKEKDVGLMDLAELDELLDWLADGREDLVDNIIEGAMDKHGVKTGRRPHIRAILDTAFKRALTEAQFLSQQKDQQ